MNEFCKNCVFYQKEGGVCEVTGNPSSVYGNCEMFEHKPIDWEQRRYEVAKQVLLGILSNEEEKEFARLTCLDLPREEALVKHATRMADALMKELKNSKQQYDD